MEFGRSAALIEAQGTDLERARLRHLLEGSPAGDEIIRSMAELQNIDGGFPHRMRVDLLSTVDSTLTALEWLEDLGLLDSPLTEKATGFLLDVQDEDGYWDEDKAVGKYDLLPWIKPGRPQSILYLTAASTFRLAAMHLEGEPAFRKGATYLSKHQDGTGKFPGVLPTTWLAAGIFLMDDPDSDAARKSLQLLRQRPMEEWTAPQLSSLLGVLPRAGIPADDPWIARCRDRLLGLETPQGGWMAEGAASADANTTLEVLRTLIRIQG